MAILNKRYCSHCGTPNVVSAHVCTKCDKPISSALKTLEDDNDEEVVVIKRKRPVAAKQRIVYEDDEDGEFGEIITPKTSDIIVGQPGKLTIGSLRDGAQIPTFGHSDGLPSDIEVKSRAPFFQPSLD